MERQSLPLALAPAPSSDLGEVLNYVRAALRARYGSRLECLVLYGSQARGDANDESDVDVLVVLTEPVERYVELKALVDFSLDLLGRHGHWVSFKLMSSDRWADGDTTFLRNVRREGRTL